MSRKCDWHNMHSNGSGELVVLVFQGGGALGAYQAGAFEAMDAAGMAPDWLAGISIGSINAAIIAGNRPQDRLNRLHGFWNRVSSGPLAMMPVLPGVPYRKFFNEVAAVGVMNTGVPGFFTPRFPPAAMMPEGGVAATSHYSTAPLRDSLLEFVDFEYLNTEGPRLSIGAVEVATGNFRYFDSAKMKIGPEHVMASGALPPGFAAVTINGKQYWDGGLVSNTPLQYVLEDAEDRDLCIFQVDLFSARGAVPRNLSDVAHREKDIRFSSRTRLTTDRFREKHRIGAAAARLRDKLPEALRDDPDLTFLTAVAPARAVTLVHLIQRQVASETQSKDYEFSRASVLDRWAVGVADARLSLGHKDWQGRAKSRDHLQVFDLGRKDL